MSLLSGEELLERLRNGERFLADGAMGTELIALGVASDKTLRANALYPEQVTAVHKRYLGVGARILLSNTFGAGDTENREQDFARGIELAINAAKLSHDPVATLVSMTCAVAQKLPASGVLAETCPTGLLLETCVSLKEALEASAKLLQSMPDLLAITCHFRADGRMPDGTEPERAALALAEVGAHMIGANCGDDPALFPEIAARMRSITDLPLLFQPCAGLPMAGGSAQSRICYPITAEMFKAIAARLFEAGANIVGGCCGTTPDHIGSITPPVSQHTIGLKQGEYNARF